MSWYRYAKDWRQRFLNRIPYPNQFLGVSNYREIRELPVHLLCAHRVLAHRRAFEDVARQMPKVVRGVSFEALVEDQLQEFSRVFSPEELRTLGDYTLVEPPQKSSLDKFRDVLSESQVSEILDLERKVLAALSP